MASGSYTGRCMAMPCNCFKEMQIFSPQSPATCWHRDQQEWENIWQASPLVSATNTCISLLAPLLRLQCYHPTPPLSLHAPFEVKGLPHSLGCTVATSRLLPKPLTLVQQKQSVGSQGGRFCFTPTLGLHQLSCSLLVNLESQIGLVILELLGNK